MKAKDSEKATNNEPSSETVFTSQAPPAANAANVSSGSNKETKSIKKSKPTKVAKSKTSISHPPYINMIKKAIGELKERKGSSKTAILKYVLQHYNVGENLNLVNAHIRQTLKRGVEAGVLHQPTGVGASGSFSLAGSQGVKTNKPPVFNALATFANQTELREKTIALHEQGKRNGEIARTLGVQRQFVSRAIKRYRELGHSGRRQGGGRRRTVTTPENCELVRKKIEQNPGVSMRQIARQIGLDERAVRRIAKELNMQPVYKLQKVHPPPPTMAAAEAPAVLMG